jgi:glutaconyl-CoA/methylmalonyl-CoA decarboxylase subunit gamma
MKVRVTIEDQNFEVEVGDIHARPVLATIDGEVFEVWPEENGKAGLGGQRAALSSEPHKSAPLADALQPVHAEAQKGQGGNKTKSVLAPIPGVILSIQVKEGDAVSVGQELCVLEAMKMKNIIRANRVGTVGAVCIAPGDQVKHGQALLQYTD